MIRRKSMSSTEFESLIEQSIAVYAKEAALSGFLG